MPNQYTPIPETTRQSLIDYVLHRAPGGSFMGAVMENNLTEALGQADDLNVKAIHPIVAWAYNFVPALARGSEEKVKAWLANEDGMLGKLTTADIQEGISRFEAAGPGPRYEDL